MNTLLRQLNDCFRKLKAQHGGVQQAKKQARELKEQRGQFQADLEKKAGQMIMSAVEQQKTQETKKAQMEEELKKISKQYEKLMDKGYLERIEANNENQKAQIVKLEKDNTALEQQIKEVERKMDKNVKLDARKQPKVEAEIKNLRQKLAYTTKKYESDYNKLLEVAAKRKDIKEKEAAVT